MQIVDNTTISMGKPITAPVLIPVEHKSTPTCINDPFMVDGEVYKVTCVSFGTPHGAVLVDDVDSIDVGRLGYSLGTHALFPKGASIVFIQVLDRIHIKARLWQQGQGKAAFTPEAACVALVVSVMLQKVETAADVSMGDNTFHVEWNRMEDNVYLTGSIDLVKS